jgi:hypothetical protein
MKNLLALALALGLATDAGATKVRPVELSELAEESEHILVGRIEMGQVIAGNCGTQYIVRVEESIKGGLPKGSAALFSNPASMTIGSKYVLFLGSEGAAFTPLLSTSSFGPGPSPERQELCAKNRPRLTVNIWGVGAFKVSGTYETAGHVAIFDDYMVHMPTGLQVKKLDLARRYDTDTAVGAVDFESLLTSLKSASTRRPN